MKYILKNTPNEIPTIVDDVQAHYVEYNRLVRDIGWAREVAGTGKFNHSKLELWPLPHYGSVYIVAATHDGVKAKVRYLRETEEQKLAEIDAQIAALKHQRRELLELAWTKGNTVTVRELTEKADAHEAKRKSVQVVAAE